MTAAPRRAHPDVVPEPRWPALVAVVAVGGLFMALHSDLVIGPRWLVPAATALLLVPTVLTHRAGRHDLNRIFGMMVTSVVTFGMVVAVVRLVSLLPSHRQSPVDLLLSAAALWFTNILVFALWYWRLDAGGPHGRDSRVGHTEGAFLFPQMTMLPEMKQSAGQQTWSPSFVDYLFLAFNTSTAFSPTDTPALTRWSKALMMLQSVISLTVLVILAARGVNIL
ncbi:MAG: hypothetical protein JWL71_2169 [Acidobacteria bacterium]|nr:hypothetical protein [Acidobacteriota bacterium]